MMLNFALKKTFFNFTALIDFAKKKPNKSAFFYVNL